MRNLHFVFAIPAVLLLVVAYSHRPRRATQWGRAQPSRKAATADAALDKLRAQLARSERATEAAAAAMARAAAQTTRASNVRLVEPPAAAAAAAVATPAVATPASAAAPPLLDCASGCAGRGTCNRHLGRCDCPPFYGGPDCAAPLFPACATQWGVFKPEVAVCGIHIQPAFPTTCDCLQQCHTLALDARQECVVDPRPGESAAAAGRRAKAAMPWMPLISNETWVQRTKDDAAASAAQKLCSGHGVLSVQLPYEFYPKDGEVQNGVNLRTTPKCRCFPGYTGKACEVSMDRDRGLHKCMNDCSGRGKCEHNWCRCDDGWWGIDCSFGAAPSTAAAALPAPARAATPKPRIYVYDLPPRFTSWLGAFRRGDWTRDHWYGVDVILHKQLLASSHRTHDPEEADFFFIPLHLSLGYYTHRYYFKHFTERSVKPLRDALKYVNTTWPYLRRHPKRHVMVMTQDQGNRFVRDLVPEAAPLIFLHHWGAPRTCAKDGAAAFPCRVDNGAQGDHVASHDVTVPPFHGEQARLNRWIADRAKNCPNGARHCSDAPAVSAASLHQLRDDFSHNLFFSGKMNLNWGRHYSLGVRQAVFRAHRHQKGFLIMTFDNGVQEKTPFETHVANYAGAKFCLAPAGYGFSSRQYECVLVGCVPIIIQDSVEMAFEDVLPWHRFSLRLNFSDIPLLPQLLARVPPAAVARMRRGLGCIWPRMLWLAPGLNLPSSIDNDAVVREARGFDAFETTMMALRRRLPGAVAEEGWRARVRSCVEEAGDDEALDIGALRAAVRAEAPTLSKDAAAVAEIIGEWRRTADDKSFAMRTRFFPSGVKIPGVKWTD